jgi:integrase
MSAGRPPLEHVGAVAVYGPTGTGPKTRYFRIKWTEPDGERKDTSAGTTLEHARWKAADVDARLSLAAGAFAVTTLATLLAEYLAEGRSPYTGDPWQKSYRNQIEDHLQRTVRFHEGYRAMDVTRTVCDTMRAQAGTDRMVRHNTTALRAFLYWGYRHRNHYFTAAQAELLPRGVVMPNPTVRGTAMPKRRKRARGVGETAAFVRDEDAPSRGLVAALGRALAAQFPAWGELAPELAANCGPRWGEQFQLTAGDVHLAGCTGQPLPHLHIDWQVDPGAAAGDPDGRRTRPKGNKTRIAPIPRLSFTGYPLREALATRVEAALAEQASGANPQALLFPALRGGLLWYTSFESDQLIPAMRAAGWPLVAWTEHRDVWSKAERSYRRVERERTMAALPWHALRHRFARVAIDLYKADAGVLMALGGWENEATVQNRYYKSGDEHTERGLELFNR